MMGVYPVSQRPKLLSIWICGEGAMFMETLDESEIRRAVAQIMQKFLGKQFPDMPQQPDEIKVILLRVIHVFFLNGPNIGF